MVKKVMSNGQPKIVFIAKEDMIRGTELFFNYGPNYTKKIFGFIEPDRLQIKVLNDEFIHHDWLYYE